MPSLIDLAAECRTLWLALLLSTVPTAAGTISLTGSLDPNDANDVYLYEFTLASDSVWAAQSFGFGGGTNAAGNSIPNGGFDPYLSLFSGWGPTATLFVAGSQFAVADDGGCPPAGVDVACRDSRLSVGFLPAGNYTLALTVFSNFSLQENLGTGNLGDGFTGLGYYYNQDTDQDRSSNWALDITSDPASSPIPEPTTIGLVCAGGAALLGGTLVKKRGRSR